MHVAYDLRAGTTRMEQCGFLGFTSVRASEAYDVIGVPMGTPVQVTAEYEVNSAVYVNGQCGGSGCCGRVVLRLQQGTAFDERSYSPTLFIGRADFHDVAGHAGGRVARDYRLHLDGQSLPRRPARVGSRGKPPLHRPSRRRERGFLPGLFQRDARPDAKLGPDQAALPLALARDAVARGALKRRGDLARRSVRLCFYFDQLAIIITGNMPPLPMMLTTPTWTPLICCA
jgi:hypothetical protein